MQNMDESRHELIDCYLRGRLAGEEREAFELRLLEDEELFEEVQRAEAMQEAFKAEGALAGKPMAAASPSRGLKRWLRQPLSMAAGLALCFSLGLNAYLGSSGREEGTSGILPVNSFAVLETLRGNGDTISIEGAAPYLLQIDVGLSAETAFTLELRDAGGKTVSSQTSPAPHDGWLRIVIGEPLSGAHFLEIIGEERRQTYSLNFSP